MHVLRIIFLLGDTCMCFDFPLCSAYRDRDDLIPFLFLVFSLSCFESVMSEGNETETVRSQCMEGFIVVTKRKEIKMMYEKSRGSLVHFRAPFSLGESRKRAE